MCETICRRSVVFVSIRGVLNRGSLLWWVVQSCPSFYRIPFSLSSLRTFLKLTTKSSLFPFVLLCEFLSSPCTICNFVFSNHYQHRNWSTLMLLCITCVSASRAAAPRYQSKLVERKFVLQPSEVDKYVQFMICQLSCNVVMCAIDSCWMSPNGPQDKLTQYFSTRRQLEERREFSLNLCTLLALRWQDEAAWFPADQDDYLLNSKEKNW